MGGLDKDERREGGEGGNGGGGVDVIETLRATSALDHSTSTVPSECVFIFYYILSSKILILLAK